MACQNCKCAKCDTRPTVPRFVLDVHNLKNPIRRMDLRKGADAYTMNGYYYMPSVVFADREPAQRACREHWGRVLRDHLKAVGEYKKALEDLNGQVQP